MIAPPMRLYLDGAEVGNRAITGRVDAADGIELGSAGEPLDGLLDEVRIHNYALTAEEIKAIFTAGGAAKCGG